MEYAVYVAAAIFVVYIVYTVFQSQSAIIEGARNRKDDSESDEDKVTKMIDELDNNTKETNTFMNQIGSKSDREDLLSAYRDNMTAHLTWSALRIASDFRGGHGGQTDKKRYAELIGMHKILKDVIPMALDSLGGNSPAESKDTTGAFGGGLF